MNKVVRILDVRSPTARQPLRAPLPKLGWLALLVAVSALRSSSGSAAEDVEVLSKAAPRSPGCALTTYRSEAEITDRFTYLCRIDITKSFALSGVDMTGRALSAVQAKACECGANGLLLDFNSSETEAATEVITTNPNYYGGYTSRVKRFRQSERVRATAILFSGEAPKPVLQKRVNQIKPGFRGITWGTVLADDFEPVPSGEASGERQVFIRPADTMRVGAFPVSTIQYLTRERRLAAVRILLGRPHWDAFKRSLDAEWGSPQKCDRGKVRCLWHSPGRVDLETTAVLTEGRAELELLIASPALYAGRLARPASRYPGIQDDPGSGVTPAGEGSLVFRGEARSPGLPSGFFGLNWGDSIPSDASFTSRDGDNDCYERASDSNLRRALAARAISWCFVNGRFRNGAAFLDPAAAKKAIERFSPVWGTPEAADGHYQWETSDGSTVVSITPIEGPDGEWMLYAFDAEFSRMGSLLE